MKNTIQMRFNLTKILSFINKNISSGNVELFLNDDSSLVAKMGEVAFYFEQARLQLILDLNGFDRYYQDETENLVSELIGKHIIIELMPSIGNIAFPEVK